MSKHRLGRGTNKQLVDEIVRRAGNGNVIPPTIRQKLQLAACRALGRPAAIVPRKCATVQLRGNTRASYELQATTDDAAKAQGRYFLKFHPSIEV
jgi:hypothetical protein